MTAESVMHAAIKIATLSYEDHARNGGNESEATKQAKREMLAMLVAELKGEDAEAAIGKLEYRGETIAHWWERAQKRRTAIRAVWDALRDAGYDIEGQKDIGQAVRLVIAATKGKG